MNIEQQPSDDFDTMTVWRAAHKLGSDDLRVWLGEIPIKQPNEQRLPLGHVGRGGGLVTILRPRISRRA
jgi:hypothetical protein